MPAKTSKEVTDRENRCQFLVTAITKQGPRIADMLLGLVRPFLLPDDAVPDYMGSLVSLTRRLGGALVRLRSADERVYAATAKRSRLRRQLDQKTKELGKLLSRFLQTVSHQFVDPSLGELGLESPTNRNAIPLLRQAERIDETFGRDNVDQLLGESSFSQPADPRAYVADVKAVADEVRDLDRQVDEHRREYDEALVEKNKAKKEHDRLFLHTARTFESFCRLAGEDELADRVRETQKRRRRTTTETGEGESPTPPPEGDGTDPVAAQEDTTSAQGV